MPLHMSVVIQEGRVHVARQRHSDSKGCTKAWTTDLPLSACPGFATSLRAKLNEEASRCSFEERPNRRHVRRRGVAFDGLGFEVHVIPTEA